MSDLDAFAGDLQARILRDAKEVYSEEVIRRWLDTPHAGVMKDPDAHARITGPCGDTMEMFLRVDDGCVCEASFVTDGCASTIACGSMACDLALAVRLAHDERVLSPRRGGQASKFTRWSGGALGKPVAEPGEVTQEAILDALGGLPEADLHCALLAARTLQAAALDRARPRGPQGKRT